MAFGYNDSVWILSVIIWTTGYDCNNHVYQKKGGRISINPKKNLKKGGNAYSNSSPLCR